LKESIEQKEASAFRCAGKGIEGKHRTERGQRISMRWQGDQLSSHAPRI